MWKITRANISIKYDDLKLIESPKLKRLLKEGYEPFSTEKLDEDLSETRYDIWLRKQYK